MTTAKPMKKGLVWQERVISVLTATITFEKLHQILQASFTWQDEHLHQFQVITDNGIIVAQSKSYDMDEFETESGRAINYFSEKKRISAYLLNIDRFVITMVLVMTGRI